MMGSKQRHFAPLMQVSLEDLVPAEHFYRHLERTLDLSFVRGFVQQTYAGGGRPSIDPIVFFKLQLVMFFEGIRSERQLMRHAADRLSVRWFLGVRHVTQGSIPSETERTGRRFFGSRAYLMPKGKGDCSMLLKHGEAKAL
jgi:transposase